jgi:hypothetical protein
MEERRAKEGHCKPRARALQRRVVPPQQSTRATWNWAQEQGL